MTKIKKLLTATVSASALLTSSFAYAQDSSGGDDEIIVTGIRYSLKQSLDVKRNADSMVEAITAVDIGKFPDKNVAESLQRITGVSINREFGEGERISIRGTDTNLTRTMLNGHAVASADWFILDQISASRSFNYLMLPSEIVSSVEVYKSPQADMDEGGVGGTVNVKTARPLDGKDFSAAGSVGMAYNALADKAKPTASAAINWRNEDKTFGVNIAGVYQNRDIRRDGFEVLGYSNVADGPNNNLPVGGADVPDLIGSALFQQNRERIGLNATVEFEPSDQLNVVASGFYSKMDANNSNVNMLVAPSRGGGGTNFTANVVDGTALSGTTTNTVFQDTFFREAATDTLAVDLDVTYELNDRTTWHANGGYSKANGDTSRQIAFEAQQNDVEFNYDLTSGVPEVSFTSLNPTDPTDPFYVNGVGWAAGTILNNADDEFYLFSDIEHELEGTGPFKSVKAGVKYTDHTRDVRHRLVQRRSLFNWGGGGFAGCDGSGGVNIFDSDAARTAAGSHNCGVADIAGNTPDNFLDDISEAGSLDAYVLADIDSLVALWDQLPGTVWAQPGDDFANATHDWAPGSYDVNEKTIGGFIMAKLEGEGWRGNFGTRVVQSDVTAHHFDLGLAAGDPGTETNNFGNVPAFNGYVARRENTTSYTDVLPSANFVFDVNDDMLVRLAAARTMTRPDFNNLSSFQSLNTTSFTGSNGGGVNLNPYRANQFDVSFEWYKDDTTAFNVGLFYKDLSTLVVQSSGIERIATTVGVDDNGTPADPTDDFADLSGGNCTFVSGTFPNELYDCDFSITRPRNAAGATLQGIEVAAQKSFDNGFGVLANYTYTDAEQSDGLPMPGASKHIANVSGFYENDALSARLSYTVRSEFFLRLDRATPLFQDTTSSLDAAVSYNLTDNFSVSLDALNLLDNKLTQFSNTKDRVSAIYDNDRTFFVTLRGTY